MKVAAVQGNADAEAAATGKKCGFFNMGKQPSRPQLDEFGKIRLPEKMVRAATQIAKAVDRAIAPTAVEKVQALVQIISVGYLHVLRLMGWDTYRKPRFGLRTTWTYP